ncbi:MAG TPA: flagellar biosynthetic protein FliR [Rhodocyclaceae bacterium]|jgi:flagellar biosynthetic protein FliR|nr:flagellar biosynthetic protein FliR [Rhodocyclaceae bacterium]
MITLTSAQLDAWILAFMFPLARILGVLALAPVFSNNGVNRTARLVCGLAITMALAPVLPPMPAMAAYSWQAIAILIREVMIGTLMGLSLSLAFAAINIAGDLISLQMGLSFAVLYDPQTQGQTPVITNLFTLLTILIFLASNGHLLILSLLARSFDFLPVSALPFAVDSLRTLVGSAATLFSLGLLLALPLIAALLIANIGLGILTRVAPTLNLFAIGFVVTLSAGFIMLSLSLPYMGIALDKLFDLCFRNLDVFLRAARGA